MRRREGRGANKEKSFARDVHTSCGHVGEVVSPEASFTCDNAPQSVNTLFAHLEICKLTIGSQTGVIFRHTHTILSCLDSGLLLLDKKTEFDVNLGIRAYLSATSCRVINCQSLFPAESDGRMFGFATTHWRTMLRLLCKKN